MTKAPDHPKEIVPQLIQDYRSGFGEDLVSLIIYGSAAAGDYVPGSSDINLMVVLSEAGIDRLDAALKIVSKWRKRNVATPLLLTEAYVQTSVDVFPLEYLNFKTHYEVVYGKDVLKGVTIDPAMLRLQCEREVRGKLLLLREGFLETNGTDRHVRELLSDSVHAFIALLTGVLYLKGKGEVLPGTGEAVIQQACGLVGGDAAVFEAVVSIKKRRSKPSGEALTKLFKSYLIEIRKFIRIVDDLEV